MILPLNKSGKVLREPATEFKPAPTGPPASVAARPFFSTWQVAALLGLLTVAVFWPMTQNGFVNYDDELYVTENVHVQNGLTWENIKWAFINPVNCNWHPVTILSHMLDCQLYGLQPAGHHWTSLLLHAFNAGLVFLLLRRLTGAVWRSALVAALFAWHPLRVESVAWVAERKDVLSAAFGFLALLCYVHYAQGRKADATKPETSSRSGAIPFYRSPFYWLGWFCFALGLMSKPMLVTWPFVLMLVDYWPLKRFQPNCLRALVLEKIPFFALTAVVSVVTFIVQKQAGAVATAEILPLEMRVENALISYCRYIGKLFWPTDLAVIYPHPGYPSLGLMLVAGVVMTVLSVWFWKQRRQYPFLLVGWLWFVGTLVPVIGLVQVGIQAMADRYSYIPSVGLLMLTIWGGYEISRRWRHQAILFTVAGLAAIIFCLVLTRQQIGYWQNSETLFRHALAVTTNNYTARYNLGLALLKRGQTDEAISQFQEALRLDPANIGAHNNLGVALNKIGRTDDAINQFVEALRLQPNYAEAHNNLGGALNQKGRIDEAINQFQETLRLQPDHANAHFNLGKAFLDRGQLDAAISQFQESVRINPNDDEARYKLGNLLANTGQTDAAIGQFQEVIRLRPSNAVAHNNLACMLTKEGRTGEAISQFQEAVRLQPGYADAYYNFANCLLKTGQFDQAISQFQTAIRLKPDYAPTHYYLGVALFQNGQTDAAISQFQEAIRLKPDYTKAHESLASAMQIKNAPAGN